MDLTTERDVYRQFLKAHAAKRPKPMDAAKLATLEAKVAELAASQREARSSRVEVEMLRRLLDVSESPGGATP